MSQAGKHPERHQRTPAGSRPLFGVCSARTQKQRVERTSKGFTTVRKMTKTTLSVAAAARSSSVVPGRHHRRERCDAHDPHRRVVLVEDPRSRRLGPEVKGGNTSVALDSGFTDALTSLGLTPGGRVRRSSQTRGVVPITPGRSRTGPGRDIRPYVQGLLNHNGSGLTPRRWNDRHAGELRREPGSSELYGDVLVNGEVAASNAYLSPCTVALSSRCSSRATTRS